MGQGNSQIGDSKLPKGNSGRRNTLSTGARGSKQTLRVGGGGMDMQSVKLTSEAIGVLKNRLHQGIAIGSYMYVEVLKRCLKRADLAAVEQVHKCVIESGMHLNIMGDRNVISWTAMIGAFAESGCGEEAYRLFLQMDREGLQPDAVTYVSTLNACASTGALEWVKKVWQYR